MTILFNTKLRKKLLTYFFTHPDEQFYVREIAGFILEDAGNLSRELKKLENEGLFNSSIKGNIKLYVLNKKYPLFQELKQIVFKTTGIQGSLKDLVQKYTGITLAFIYGSYAKNAETKTSDIDLAVVGKFPHPEFTSQIRELELKLNREINFSVYEQDEFDNEKNKNGSFLQLALKEKIIPLKGTLHV